MVTWGPGMTAADRHAMDARILPTRVPLSAIFKPGAGAQEGLARQASLRHLVSGDGE